MDNEQDLNQPLLHKNLNLMQLLPKGRSLFRCVCISTTTTTTATATATAAAAATTTTTQDCPCNERPTTRSNPQQLPTNHMSEHNLEASIWYTGRQDWSSHG